MRVLNIFGAPGSGKSLAALGLVGWLKRMRWNAEYVPEFAKDQVWANSSHKLKMQNWIFANQEMRLRMLSSRIAFAVTDSPLPLSVFYEPDGYPSSFRSLVFYFFNEYDNVNVFLKRTHAYSTVGRMQNEAEAQQMELRMEAFLHEFDIPFIAMDAADASPENLAILLSGAPMPARGEASS